MTSLQFPLASFHQSDLGRTPFDPQSLVRRIPDAPAAERDVLMICADAGLCDSASQVFAGIGFRVKTLADSAQGLMEAVNPAYCLVVLDAVLPVLDGLGLLHELRTRSSVPVLLIAASEEHCMAALEAGADDFVMRPVGIREMLTRSQALLKKSGQLNSSSSSVLHCDDLSVNLKTHEAFLGAQPLSLTNIEFAILKCLVRSAGKIVSRDELATVLYQRKSTPFERSIDVHISHLRKKIEAAGKSCIRTIRGVGYLLITVN